MDWLNWFRNALFQPAHDERVAMVEEEVQGLKSAYTDLKSRTEALEAFHRLAKDGP